MAAIKIHVGALSNTGTGSADFRGDRFIGSAHGDEHRTILELDPATPEQIALALEYGPRLNELLSAKTIRFMGMTASARIGVWDD